MDDADAGHERGGFVPGESVVYRNGLYPAQQLLKRQGSRPLGLGQRRVQAFGLLEPQRPGPATHVLRLGCRRVHLYPRVGGFEFGQSAQVIHVVVRNDHAGQGAEGKTLLPGCVFEERQKTGVTAVHQDEFVAVVQQDGVQGVFPAGKSKIEFQNVYVHG
jgi:hypothetical protein